MVVWFLNTVNVKGFTYNIVLEIIIVIKKSYYTFDARTILSNKKKREKLCKIFISPTQIINDQRNFL